LESANLDACFALNVPLTQKLFWTHLMEFLGDVGYVQSCFGPIGDRVSSVLERCTVCAERSIGSEIVLDAPDGTPR
jgi:hypothetical protein